MPDNFYFTTIADNFDHLMNAYDVARRVEIIFADFFRDCLDNKLVLDAGAGTGIFSREAAARKAKVVSVDLGESLLRQVAQKVPSLLVVGSILDLPFDDSTFDCIISSEVIEHTPNPSGACAELARVLKPGGWLALTCPNRIWQFPVRLASRLSLRPFAGVENFLTFRELRLAVEAGGLRAKRHCGFHPWPFQFSLLWSLSRRVDKRFGNTFAGHYMINQAIFAQKPDI